MFFNLFKKHKKVATVEKANNSNLLAYYKNYIERLKKFESILNENELFFLKNLMTYNTIENDIKLNFSTKNFYDKAEEWEALEKEEDIKTNILNDSYYISTIEIIEALRREEKEEKETKGLKFKTPLISVLENPKNIINEIFIIFYYKHYYTNVIYPYIYKQIKQNVYIPKNSKENEKRKIIYPIDSNMTDNNLLINKYLKNTPFIDYFNQNIIFNIKYNHRFEHTHILGGTGHGKTQLLSHFLIQDLEDVKKGLSGFAVIDGQGDLINTISKLDIFNPRKNGNISDKLIIIDPQNIEFPISFNIFDIDFTKFTNSEKEETVNQSAELYGYIFSSVMGNELTSRQSTIFKFSLRLVIEIPNATILTLKELLEEIPQDGQAQNSKFYTAMNKLDPIAKDFFINHYYMAGNDGFTGSRKQIVTRLLSILSVPALARIFSSVKNKINLFEAMNNGKIVLVHTRKDNLQPTGNTLFGRLFIAMFTQSALMRTRIEASNRKPYFLYIDECQDYIDAYAENLFNQARKYKLGLVVAHQNFRQVSSELRETINASTSIKFVGGANYKDSSNLSKEMRTSTTFIQDMKKENNQTNFALFVKNQTPQAIKIEVPFGQLENMPRMNEASFNELLAINNVKYGQSPLNTQEDNFNEDENKSVDSSGIKDKGFKLGKRSAI